MRVDIHYCVTSHFRGSPGCSCKTNAPVVHCFQQRQAKSFAVTRINEGQTAMIRVVQLRVANKAAQVNARCCAGQLHDGQLSIWNVTNNPQTDSLTSMQPRAVERLDQTGDILPRLQTAHEEEKWRL